MGGERNHTDGTAHLAQVSAFLCANCDKGNHKGCREASSFTSSRVQVCTCVCNAKETVGLGELLFGASGRAVGRKMADGRVYGFGPMGVPA